MTGTRSSTNASEGEVVSLFHRAEYDRVIELASHALMQQPGWADGWKLLGISLIQLGRNDEALAVIRRALPLIGGDPTVWFNLGLLLGRMGEDQRAEVAYRKAASLKPDFPEAMTNLANLLRARGEFESALDLYRRALNLAPASVEILENIAVTDRQIVELGSALRRSREELDRHPDSGAALTEHFRLSRMNAEWSGMDDIEARLRRAVAGPSADPGDVLPFTFLSVESGTREEQRRCARQYTERNFKKWLSKPPLCAASTVRRRLHDRLRVGYLSADFHSHATSLLIAGVLEQHDKGALEVHAYSTGPDDDSGMRSRVTLACEHFHELGGVDEARIAERILHDEVDILVDLKGFTQDHKLMVSALRPAPLIVNWLGFPGTLGHERLADYLIGDGIVSPLAHADGYSEKLALMPHCYQPNDRLRPVGDPVSRPEAGLPEHAFVYCCFNQTYKVTRRVFDLWCRILGEVEGSVLWLLQPEQLTAVDTLRHEARARGIAPERLIFAPKQGVREHMRRLQCADLALDTFPYTSHTTGSDALWAGVPLVTCSGETFASRVAASLLTSADMTELIARDWEDYVRLAVALGRDRPRHAALRARLVAGRESVPLFDTARFARDLERLYRRMWDNWRQGLHDHLVLEAN